MSHTIMRIVWGWDLTCCNPSRLSSSHFWYACSIYVLLGCQWVVYAKYSRNPVLPAQSTAAPCCYWATSQGNQVSWIFLCHSCWCFWVLASSTGCIWRVIEEEQYPASCSCSGEGSTSLQLPFQSDNQFCTLWHMGYSILSDPRCVWVILNFIWIDDHWICNSWPHSQ